MQTLACLSHTIVRHCWLIQQLDKIVALLCTVLASGSPFSPAYSKEELAYSKEELAYSKEELAYSKEELWNVCL